VAASTPLGRPGVDSTAATGTRDGSLGIGELGDRHVNGPASEDGPPAGPTTTSTADSAAPAGDRSDAAALMRVQADAIRDAADRLDHDAFERAVDLVVGCEGKVVVSGAGTSGNIARKITATLTSTGSAAVFLHPGDALHGGLGILMPGDVAIVLSNSGETDEILAFLPHLEHRKVPVIAILGNVDSTLARHADAVLDAGAAREACPLNLAPTSSTSVALALGDALAIAAMRINEITPEDFALNHPSGRLGKRLTLKVDDLMHAASDRPAVAVDAEFFAVVGAISSSGLGAVTVEDDGVLLGIVTDGDLRRAVQRTDPAQLAQLRAADVMTSSPVSVRSGVLAYDALRLMEDRVSQINVLPVVDQVDRCVGLVRLHDLVRSGI
jgi:arabinose-5-phosphate isomerase